jgi:DNA modification methylase
VGVEIICGDSLDVLPTLRAASFDLVLTDPPYVIGAVSAGNIGTKAGGWGDIMNSARWFRDWYSMARRVLKPDGALWTFCNWRSLPVVMKAAADADWSIVSTLVWDKDWIGPGGSVGLRPAYELVALLPMPDFAIPNRGIPDVWKEPWSSFKPSGHPAEKPVPLLSRLIQASGKEGGAILDPFCGSGSTLRAAADLGCSGVGIEVEERWCVVARGRLQQLTLIAQAAD